MSYSHLSFLNPLSKTSGVKLSKYARFKPVKGAEKIQDKTVVENVHILYEEYKKRGNRIDPDYGFFNEIGLTYKALTGLHYGVYTHLNERKEEGVGGIGAKGILDFLILPLIARKLLWDSLIFIGNDENYRLSGTFDDLSKGICWVGLIPSVALVLGLELIRLSLAAALAIVSVYTAAFAGLLTSPIWLPIVIYNCYSTNSPVEVNDGLNNDYDDVVNINGI